MTHKCSITSARRELSRLIRLAEAGNVIELTRRGESVAVLIGSTRYERLVSRSRRFSEAWDEFIADVRLEKLRIDPDAIFAGVRE